MNWLDILITIVALYSIFKGYKTGLVKQLASLASILACILLSGKISAVILPYLEQIGKIPDNLMRPITFTVSFILIFVTFMILGHMLQSIIQTVKLGRLNKLAGAGLCFAKWIIIVSLVLNIVMKIDSQHQLVPSDIENSSKSFKYVQPIAPNITPYLRFDLQDLPL